MSQRFNVLSITKGCFLNSCHFTGNLTRDPELKNLQNDKRVVNFGIAVNGRTYKKGDQELKEVLFLTCEAWDTGADVIAKHFTKGKAIIVRGELREDTWKGPNGEDRKGMKLRVEKFWFPPGGGKSKAEDEASPAPPMASAQAASQGKGDDEIPF